MSLLRAQGIVAGYVRDLPIVRGVSLCVDAGEVVALLGPNGAGKSTFLKAVAAVIPVSEGEFFFEDKKITGTLAHALSALGVGFVPQTANVFTTLSVEENLRIGGYLLGRELKERLAQAYARFPALAGRRRSPGSALSGGERQMLAMARALMTAPRLMLLDEPSAGLSPRMVSEVFSEIRRIADAGIGVLMVEQNVKAGLRIADRGIVLANGQIVRQGQAADLARDPSLAHAFLGRTSRSAGA